MAHKLRRGAAMAVLFILMVLASRQAGLVLRGRPADAAVLLLALVCGTLVWWWAMREK